MNHLSLILLCGLLIGISSYAIEGRWQSTNENKTIIAVSATIADQNGRINYNLEINGCSPPLSFAISQSYMQITNLGKPSCSGSKEAALMASLQEKFFYFQIYY